MRIIASFLRYTGHHTFHIRHYKSSFIANSSSRSCTTTELSLRLTSCLTAINTLLLNVLKKFMRGMVIWYIKNSGDILHKLKSKEFLASSLSTFDFSVPLLP